MLLNNKLSLMGLLVFMLSCFGLAFASPANDVTTVTIVIHVYNNVTVTVNLADKVIVIVASPNDNTGDTHHVQSPTEPSVHVLAPSGDATVASAHLMSKFRDGAQTQNGSLPLEPDAATASAPDRTVSAESTRPSAAMAPTGSASATLPSPTPTSSHISSSSSSPELAASFQRQELLGYVDRQERLRLTVWQDQNRITMERNRVQEASLRRQRARLGMEYFRLLQNDPTGLTIYSGPRDHPGKTFRARTVCVLSMCLGGIAIIYLFINRPRRHIGLRVKNSALGCPSSSPAFHQVNNRRVMKTTLCPFYTARVRSKPTSVTARISAFNPATDSDLVVISSATQDTCAQVSEKTPTTFTLLSNRRKVARRRERVQLALQFQTVAQDYRHATILGFSSDTRSCNVNTGEGNGSVCDRVLSVSPLKEEKPCTFAPAPLKTRIHTLACHTDVVICKIAVPERDARVSPIDTAAAPLARSERQLQHVPPPAPVEPVLAPNDEPERGAGDDRPSAWTGTAPSQFVGPKPEAVVATPPAPVNPKHGAEDVVIAALAEALGRLLLVSDNDLILDVLIEALGRLHLDLETEAEGSTRAEPMQQDAEPSRIVIRANPKPIQSVNPNRPSVDIEMSQHVEQSTEVAMPTDEGMERETGMEMDKEEADPSSQKDQEQDEVMEFDTEVEEDTNMEPSGPDSVSDINMAVVDTPVVAAEGPSPSTLAPDMEMENVAQLPAVDSVPSATRSASIVQPQPQPQPPAPPSIQAPLAISAGFFPLGSLPSRITASVGRERAVLTDIPLPALQRPKPKAASLWIPKKSKNPDTARRTSQTTDRKQNPKQEDPLRETPLWTPGKTQKSARIRPISKGTTSAGPSAPQFKVPAVPLSRGEVNSTVPTIHPPSMPSNVSQLAIDAREEARQSVAAARRLHLEDCLRWPGWAERAGFDVLEEFEAEWGANLGYADVLTR